MTTATKATPQTLEEKAAAFDALMGKKNARKAKSKAIKEAKAEVLQKHPKDFEAALTKRGLTLVK